MIQSEKGVLQFESDRWQACPLLADGSFLSAGKVIKRDVTFSFRVFSPRQDGNSEIFDVEVGTEQTFIVNYHPGKPSSIAVISPLLDDILELKAGDNVPPIKIACFDEFGNRTASHQCESWHLKLDIDGPLQSHLDTPESYDIPVLSSGEATLTNFKVRRMGGSERVTESHRVYLETPDFLSYGGDPPQLSIVLNSEMNDDSYHDDVGGSRRSERNKKRKRGEEMVCRTIIDLRSRGNIYLDNRKLITFI